MNSQRKLSLPRLRPSAKSGNGRASGPPGHGRPTIDVDTKLENAARGEGVDGEIVGGSSPNKLPVWHRIIWTMCFKTLRLSEHLAGTGIRKDLREVHDEAPIHTIPARRLSDEKKEAFELPIFNSNCPMTATLLPEQISRIVRFAWEDRTSFEEIEKRTGFVERDVIAVMRRELKPSSFRLWRKRVNGRITKHRRLLERKLKGPPAADFDD